MLYIVLILVLAALGGVVTALITANSLWAWISIGLSVLAGIVLFVEWMRRRSAAGAPPAEQVEQAETTVDSVDSADTADTKDSAGFGVSEETDVAKDASDEAEHAKDEARPAADPESVPAGTGNTADDAETAESGDSAGSVGQDQPKFTIPVSAAATAVLPASGRLVTNDVSAEDAVPEDESDPAEARTRTDTVPGEEETDAADLLIVSELDVEVVVVDEYPRYHLADCGWLVDRDTIPIEVAEARELGFTPCARCGPDATLATAHRRRDKSRTKR